MNNTKETMEERFKEKFFMLSFMLSKVKIHHYTRADYERAKLLQKMFNTFEEDLLSFIQSEIDRAAKEERERIYNMLKVTQDLESRLMFITKNNE